MTMPAEVIVLHPVDWLSPPDPGDYVGSYRKCDLCEQDATDDLLVGKSVEEFRGFWRQHGGNDDGLVICERCIDEYLKEKP